MIKEYTDYLGSKGINGPLESLTDLKAIPLSTRVQDMVVSVKRITTPIEVSTIYYLSINADGTTEIQITGSGFSVFTEGDMVILEGSTLFKNGIIGPIYSCGGSSFNYLQPFKTTTSGENPSTATVKVADIQNYDQNLYVWNSYSKRIADDNRVIAPTGISSSIVAISNITYTSFGGGIDTDYGLVTTAIAHGLITGQRINISDPAGSYPLLGWDLPESKPITVIDSTSFRFSLTSSNPGPLRKIIDGAFSTFDITGYFATISFSSVHNLSASDVISVSLVTSSGPGTYNGIWTVATIDSPTSITFHTASMDDPGAWMGGGECSVRISHDMGSTTRALVGSDYIVTMGFSFQHNLNVGQPIEVLRATSDGIGTYNGNWIVASIVSAYTITYNMGAVADPGNIMGYGIALEDAYLVSWNVDGRWEKLNLGTTLSADIKAALVGANAPSSTNVFMADADVIHSVPTSTVENTITNSASNAVVPLTIKGHATQSARILNITNSADVAKVYVDSAYDFYASNAIHAAGQIYSSVAYPAAPFVIDSIAVVGNLNADLLDGYNESAFIAANAHTNTISPTTDVVALKLNPGASTTTNVLELYDSTPLVAVYASRSGNLIFNSGYKLGAGGKTSPIYDIDNAGTTRSIFDIAENVAVGSKLNVGVYAYDRFNRANGIAGTSLSGHTWVGNGVNNVIFGNQLTLDGLGNSLIDTGFVNGVLKFTARQYEADTGFYFRASGDVSGSNPNAYIQLGANSSTLTLGSSIGAIYAWPWTAGMPAYFASSHDYEIIMEGNTLTIKIDGSTQYSGSSGNAAVTGTKFGFQCVNTSGSGVPKFTCDNFYHYVSESSDVESLNVIYQPTQIRNIATTSTPLTIYGTASQTANLQEWGIDGTGSYTVLAKVDNVGYVSKVKEHINIAASDETTNLTTGVKIAWRMPYAFTVTEVRASLTTAQPSGATLLTVDLLESAVSILSPLITFTNTFTSSRLGGATQNIITDTSLADDAEMTVQITAIGDAGAKGLKVTLIGYRT
jgi:hypothetical protein